MRMKDGKAGLRKRGRKKNSSTTEGRAQTLSQKSLNTSKSERSDIGWSFVIKRYDEDNPMMGLGDTGHPREDYEWGRVKE